MNGSIIMNDLIESQDEDSLEQNKANRRKEESAPNAPELSGYIAP
jgi:hypothetical protein